MVRAVLYCTFPLKVEYLYLWEMTVLFSKDREIHYLKVEDLQYMYSCTVIIIVILPNKSDLN